MTIPINKWVCGNCLLLDGTHCREVNSVREPYSVYCFHLFDNFIDRGFAKSEYPPTNINFREIEEECRVFNELLEKRRHEQEGGKYEEIDTQGILIDVPENNSL